MKDGKGKKFKLSVGGQAVIEGIMMRSPNKIAMAVRKHDGEIEIVDRNLTPLSKRKKFFGFFIVRGALNLFDALYWGIKYLELSAQLSQPKDENPKSKSANALWSGLSMLVAFALAMFIFLYLPLKCAGLLALKDRPFEFNLVAGVIRVVLFLIYLLLISLLPDVKRLFQYHGAEHKTINAFENNEPLEIKRIKLYSTFHSRCGTSFIFIVAVIAILFFAVFDGLLYKFWGIALKPVARVPYHLLLLPIIAGISYEILKISDKLSNKNFIFKILTLPGLYLQRITTKPPTDDMLEIAIAALKKSLENVNFDNNREH